MNGRYAILPTSLRVDGSPRRAGKRSTGRGGSIVQPGDSCPRNAQNRRCNPIDTLPYKTQDLAAAVPWIRSTDGRHKANKIGQLTRQERC